LVLVARDQGSPTWHESLKLLTVNLIDVNDNMPRFPVYNDHKPLYTFYIKENNRPQYKIGNMFTLILKILLLYKSSLLKY